MPNPQKKIQWRFAPTGGGVRHGFNNAGAEHFRSAPEEKLIREIIQNSLDAAHPAVQAPVEVDIFLCHISLDDIGARGLKQHLLSCRQIMREKEQHAGETAYTKSLRLLRKSRIPALAVIDRNTTGLTGSKWNSLIFEEGIPAKESEGAAGGSFGIGKNAPYNAAELHAVIYSTLYSSAVQGRVEKMAGRAVLVSHLCPHSRQMLQNIGFFTDAGGEAVWGREMPQPFRLSHAGTGLWILGFRPGKRWLRNAVKATADNFFQAIHSRKLVVRIRDAPDAKSALLRYDTVEGVLDTDTGTRKSDSLYFYRAVRQAAVDTTRPAGSIGSFDVYLHQDEQAPNRVAYVNRRGMLITATKERRKSNPFHPARGAAAGWANYAAVVIAANDNTDLQIRAMENPAHDEISVGRLSGSQGKQTREAIYRASAQVTDILDRRLRNQAESALSNLKELASLFPDFDPDVPGNRELATRTIQPKPFLHNIRPAKANEVPESEETTFVFDVEGEETDLWTEGPGPRGNGPSSTGNRGRAQKSIPRTIRDMVVLRTGPGELKVALATKPERNGKVCLTLHPGGEEFRNANRIPIRKIRIVQPGSVQASASDDVLTVTPPPGHQGYITIFLDIDPDTPTSGYRFYERKDP